ncbi:BI1-like protein [Actinidia chinensis var. chinensis]|uniref:BI1-like protein n=1 Tax=Actinidia chinensis var. chinensis TaxID=1590841 RepID=A0A2R6QU19_ACTCC|nr:BI1-like protein [Actinidia chinensis var. chinensis]
MWNRKADVESGAAEPLYPMMLESPELRWAFIRKIYSILSIQLLLTVGVAAFVATFRPISVFLTTTGAGLAVYIVLIFMPFIVLWPMYYYHQRHPVNYILLAVFTVSIAFAVGLSCAFTSQKAILEAVILTTGVVVSLTLYTFWAARRGHDFKFLGPFLSVSLFVLILAGFIQLFFPLSRSFSVIYGVLASIVFCGYIIYDTDNLIKRYTYDEYIWASVSLYLDIINLFLSLLTIFRSTN